MNLNDIYCMDCLEGMRDMPNDSVKLTVTSPPYNIGHNHMSGRKYEGYGDKRKDYLSWLKCRLDEMIRVSETVFLNIQILSANKRDVLDILSDYRGNLKDMIVWTKTNPVPQQEHGVLNNAFEFILIFSKDRPEIRKFSDVAFRGTLSNVISTPVNSSNRWVDLNRATFPIQIPNVIIKHFSREGDVILDPFMGTGTTAESAIQLNRKFIGFEIDERQVIEARRRVSNYQGLLFI